MRATITFLCCCAVLGVSQPTGAQMSPDSAADARRTVDLRLKTLNDSALAAARTSGSRFPSYNRWLGEVASAIRSGMSPARLSRSGDPIAATPRDAEAILTACDDAAADLGPFIAPAPQSRNLGKIAAYKQNVQPRKLTVVLLTDFFGKGPPERAAAAEYLRSAYSLPQELGRHPFRLADAEQSQHGWSITGFGERRTSKLRDGAR